jgi:predicted XRE-type DNA-binding protein
MPNGKNVKRAKSGTESRIEPSSGNVFADLGISNPDLALAKAELVQLIRSIINARELTQAKAARILGLDQPKVSALVRGRVDGYSLDRLFRFLNALDQHIEISVRSTRKTKTTADRSITVTY